VTETLQWSPDWEIGIERIDNQHRELVKLLADLQQQSSAQAERVNTVGALVVLSDYVEFHFGDEEALMRQVGFPELEAHVREHLSFVTQFQQMSRDFRMGNTELGAGVITFLATWVLEHIAHSDAKIARFMTAKTQVL
jgi:hemerythrin